MLPIPRNTVAWWDLIAGACQNVTWVQPCDYCCRAAAEGSVEKTKMNFISVNLYRKNRKLRETDRQTDRQRETDRQTDRDKQKKRTSLSGSRPVL